MKKPKMKIGIAVLACLLVVGGGLLWSHQNLASSLKSDPAQITAMDIVKVYSGEKGAEPGPVTYSAELSGEDFARLTAGISFWRLPGGSEPGTYSGDLPQYRLRIQCGDTEYSAWLSPDGKQLSLNGQNIRVFGDLLEQLETLAFFEEPGGNK